MRRPGPFVLLAHAAAKVPLHAANTGGLSSLATIILALAPAAVGMGLTIHPPKRGRLTRLIAFVCYLAAAELLGLLVSVPVLVRVGVGVVAAVAFSAWEWQAHRAEPALPLPSSVHDKPAAHTTRDKAKVNVVRSPHKGYERLDNASGDSEVTYEDSPIDRDS